MASMPISRSSSVRSTPNECSAWAMPATEAAIAPAISAESWMSRSGPPVAQERLEVGEHRLDPRPTEHAAHDVPRLVPGRDLAPVRHLAVELAQGGGHVETRRAGVEAHGAHVRDETRIRGDGDVVAGGPEGEGEWRHRVEVPGPDHAGEQDAHQPSRRTSAAGSSAHHRQYRR